MSKTAQNAAAQFHKCPTTSDEIRVKGFAYCPFCAAKINADGDHNVVISPDIVETYRAQQAAQPKPEPAPEPKPQPKPEPPKAETPELAPEQPRVKTAEEIEKLINDAFPKSKTVPPITLADPVVNGPKPPKPRSSLLPLLIFAALIGGGGYYAWTLTQPQATVAAFSEFDATLPDPAAEGVDLTDTGGKPNPDITSSGVTLEPRSVTAGLKREIRFNNANIRALPTQESRILAQLQREAIISPTGRISDLRGSDQGEWYRVEEPVVGFVRFGNTKAAAAANPDKPVAVKTFPVDPPGLRVMAEITLRIRSTPSRVDNSNFTGNRMPLGEIFMPKEYAMDMGKDPGRKWYKVPGGYVAEWETKKLDPAARPPSGSTDPSPRTVVDNLTPEADASDRGQSTTTRALDALRKPRDPAEPN
jgi:hypothetical protein